VATGVDVANCGACGQTCGTGTLCVGGSCVSPSTLWLATGLGTPGTVAVDSQNVYWDDSSTTSISAVSKNGGAVTPIAQNTPATFFLGDDAYLYYTSGGTVLRALRDGTGSPSVALSTLPSSPVPAILSGVDATNLYFLVSNNVPAQSLVSIPIGGGTTNPIFSYGASTQVDVSVFVEGTLYAVAHNLGIGYQVYAGSTDTGEIHGYPAMSAYGGCVYYESGFGPMYADAIRASQNATCFGGTIASTTFAGTGCGIVSATSAGASPAGIYLSGVPGLSGQLLIGSGLSHVVQLTADANAVYWTDATGAIGKLPLP
jgi:hypothetical protein